MSSILEELVRILGMQLVLTPAAYLLPRRLALVTADCLACLLLPLPNIGLATYWDLRRVFGRSRFGSLRLTSGWLARPFRDFVILKRLLSGRENPCKWAIIERNADEVSELRRSGKPYIVATAHYSREALFGLYSPNVTRGRTLALAHIPAEKVGSLQQFRIRLQLKTLNRAGSRCWGKGLEIVPVGPRHFPLRKVYNELRVPGTVVVVHVDAPWRRRQYQAGWYERPFAARDRYVFATGTAQLARLARCPVVSCVYSVDENGALVLDWGSPILPDGQEAGTDVKIMDALIDELEIAIGERPTQYCAPVGGVRRWNQITRRWQEL